MSCVCVPVCVLAVTCQSASHYASQSISQSVRPHPQSCRALCAQPSLSAALPRAVQTRPGQANHRLQSHTHGHCIRHPDSRPVRRQDSYPNPTHSRTLLASHHRCRYKRRDMPTAAADDN